MALRLRRGTDAERQSITPKQGELLYVTDTGLLYVGDGTTQGGNRVSGSLQDESNPTLSATLDLNGNDIVGTGNINIDGNITATGNINIGDGVEDNVIVGGTISSDLVPTSDTAFDLGSETFRWQNGYFTGLTVDGELSVGSITVGDIYADNSTLIFNSLTGTLTGDFSGNLISEDQSTIIIDASNNNGQFDNLTSETIFVDNLFPLEVSSSYIESTILETGEMKIPQAGKLSVEALESNNSIELQLRGNEDNSVIRLTKVTSTDLTGLGGFYGSISFERDDINGSLSTNTIAGAEELLFFANDSTGEYTDTSKWIGLRNGLLGIGTIDAEEKLDVHGNCIIRGNFTSTNLNITESAEITGELTVAAVKGSVVADDSTIIIDAVNNTITSGGFIQFGSYTDTNRPTGENGMVIYNTTVNKFQGYQNNAWINLDDGSLA